ncbi:hypothetical protein FOZ60_010161 [Perkinsus olseni]|uniref:Uncharacterized protein n=1 Tax=Perkinsus olseni TaxID=32597 RepID=A0A7J6PC35_PEROL|nr:hypothetical protein FOZ60_010161 [Perkinsus olseni]
MTPKSGVSESEGDHTVDPKSKKGNHCHSTGIDRLTDSLDVIALLDTGSTVNLVSREFASKLSAPIENCDNQPSIGLADGLQKVKPLGGSTISIETTHSRVSIWCWVVPTLAFDLVVGTPGLFQLGVRLHFNKDTVEPAVFFDTDALNSSEHPDGGDCTYEYTGKDALLSCGMTLEPEVVPDDIGGTLHTGKWTDPLALEVCTGTDGTSWYELKDFPWTDSTRPAPNLKEAIGRNRSMFNGLSPDEKIALQKEFQTLVDSGRVVKVKKADCSHFIPLRPVIKEVGPTTDGWSAKKVRLTVDGRRINQWVRKGSTDGDSGILANLLIWRCGCHAISLDLSSAFHGIKLGTTCLPYASIYIFDEFWQWTVLAFGWGFSPACLFQSIKPIMDDTRSDTKSFLCWYVDDLKLVSDSREDLVKDEQTLVNNLNAKDFHTQDKKRVSTIDSEGYFGHLGYGWFIPQGDSPDIIMITLPAALETALSDIGQGVPLTRRKLLAIYSSWYDPMGLYLSVSIKARLNMRLANQSGISWDDPLRGEDEERLLEWVANLKSANLRIPRAVAFEELYCYTDASGAAWAAILCCPPRESAETRAQEEAPLVVFRGIGGIFGSTNSMESWTIPKKELYALFRGCEAMVKVANILEEAGLIRSTSQLRWFLYTDSAISVFRLKGGDKKLSKIEAKWITYIRATCRSFGWCVSHVNGSRNVADSPSRGVIFPENAGDHACLSLSIKEARLVASGLSLASYNPTQGSHGDDEAEDGAEQQLCAVAGTTDSGDVLPSFNVSDVFDTNKLLDHQQRSTLLRELGRWYTNGKRWDETFTLPRRFVEVEGPLYEVAEDGLLYRISCVDTKGDVMKKVALAREDPSFINSVIDKVHDLVGHLGTDKVGPAVKFNFYCPRLSTLVNQRLRTCHQCQVINASRRTTKVWGRVSFKGTRPAQVVAIDFMIMPEGKFVGSSVVFRGILSITCGVIIVLQQLFGDISYPACVVTDGFTPGTPWLQKGQLHRLKKWLYSMNVAVAVMPPHGGPYCGWFERGHAHVRKFIKVQVMNGEDKSSWPNYIGLSQLSMNISPYSAESPLAPIDLIFGAGARRPWEHRIVGLDDECFTGIRHLFAPQEYAYLNKLYNAEQERWRGNFSRYIQFWIKNREEQQAALQRRYGKSASNCADIAVGDLVLVYCPAKDKLTPSFCGPYKVTEVVSPQLRRIEVTACGGRHSTRDISPLQLVSNMVKYYEREEDPGVQHWLQCSNAKCQAWHMTDEITANRFKSCDSKVTCSFFGARCAEGGGSVTV